MLYIGRKRRVFEDYDDHTPGYDRGAIFWVTVLADEAVPLKSYITQYRFTALLRSCFMIRRPWDYSSTCASVFPQGKVFGKEGT